MGREVQPDGAKIRCLREGRGWQEQDLADKTECSLRTVQNLEKGRRCFKSTLTKFAQVFGVQYDVLLPQATACTEPQVEPATPDPLVMIHISLTIPIEQFDETEELTAFIQYIKGLIMKNDDFVDVTVKKGSTVIVITMTETEALELTKAFREGKLKDLPVRGFGIERLPDADPAHFDEFLDSQWKPIMAGKDAKANTSRDSSEES